MGGSSSVESSITETGAAAAQGRDKEWRNRLERDFGVRRDQALLSTLPMLVPPSSSLAAGAAAGAGVGLGGDAGHRSPTTGTGSPPRRSASPGGGSGRVRGKAERQALGLLVAARARQEAIRDLVSMCANSCDKGPWLRIPKRPLPDLLLACQDLAASLQVHTLAL